MMGQHIEPEQLPPLRAASTTSELKEYMAKYRAQVAEVVNALPLHADFVKQYAGASPTRGNSAEFLVSNDDPGTARFDAAVISGRQA